MKKILKTLGYGTAIVLAAGGAFGFMALDESLSSEVRLSEVSAEARATILQHVGRGEIAEIERSTRNGVPVFEVVGNGERVSFVVAEDGTYLGSGEHASDGSEPDTDDEADGGEVVTVITLAEAPGSVREAFTKRAEGGKATRVERIVDEDVTKYEIDYDAKAGPSSMTFTDHGHVLEVESPVADGQLPEAVRREIEKDHPGAKIKHADSVQVFFYEVAVEGADGKAFEVIALATGDIEDGVFGGESEGQGEHADHDEDDDEGHADRDDDDDEGHADHDDEDHDRKGGHDDDEDEDDD